MSSPFSPAVLSPEGSVSVLIADDHPIFRRGLSEVIGSSPDLKIVAEAESGRRALELIRALEPAVAVLDVHMPDGSGLDVVRAMLAEKVATASVLLTMYNDAQTLEAAIALGVRGYVLKDSAMTDIVDCLHSVAAGRPYITPSLSGHFLAPKKRSPFDALTPAELRVVQLIAEYKTSKEIAAELGIHPRTVDNHRTNAASKLGIQGSHALFRFAIEHKSEL